MPLKQKTPLKAKKPMKKKKGKRAKRTDYSQSLRNRIEEETEGLCQHCIKFGLEHPYDQIHHPYPRGHIGKGVYTNAYPVCLPIHDKLEADINFRKEIREEFEKKYGKYFYKDKIDLENIWRYEKNIDWEAIRIWEKHNRQKVDL